MWICGFLTIIALYIKNSKLPDKKRSGFVDFYDLWSADALVAQNDVDLWIFENHNIITERLKVTGRKMQWICGFLWSLKCRWIRSAKWCGFVDFWKSVIQYPNSQSNRTQIAVDLWIFIMDLYIACLGFETLIVQIDVDLWIFENQKIKIQKVKVTVHKRLWICGFSLWTYLWLV